MPQPHGDTFRTSQTFLTSQRFLTDTATAAPEHIADRAHAIERPVDGEDDGHKPGERLYDRDAHDAADDLLIE